MTSNWYARILAVLLAVLCWYLVSGRERVDSWTHVRIETAGLAEGLVLRGAPREYLDVLVRGPKGLARKMDSASLVWTLDARKLAAGLNTVVVEPESIPVPKPFEVVEVRPGRIEVVVERRQSRSVPVRLAFRDASHRDYDLSAAVDPAQVTITGPESVLRDLKEVHVQPLSLPEESSGRFETVASLVLPDQVEASPRMVKVQARFAPAMREAAVDAPVRLVYQGRHLAYVFPETVLIRFRAPGALLREGAWRGLVDAYVELDPRTPPGRHDVAYRVTLPQGCELVQARPEKVTVTVK